MSDKDNNLLLHNPFRRGLEDIKGRDDLQEDQQTRRVFGYRDPWKPLPEDAGIPERVCVVGGGIAGLTAAYELDRLAAQTGRSMQIDVLERTERFGGRIRTHSFDEHNYVELGPMRIPSYHMLVQHYISEFNLSTHDFFGGLDFCLADRPISDTCELDNRVGAYTAARHLLDSYQGDTRRLVESLMRVNPTSSSISIGALESNFIAAISGLTTKELRNISHTEYGTTKELNSRWDLFLNYPKTSWGRALEGLTIRQGFEFFLRQKASTYGWPKGLSPDGRGRLADEIWERFGRVTGLIWLEHISLAHYLREVTAINAKTKIAIEGGFQRLADAFVGRLRRSPRVKLETYAKVERIELGETGVRITSRWPAGHPTVQAYDRVICAVPAAAALQIRFEPELPRDQRNAFASISYLSASKSAAYFSCRFWENLTPAKIGGATQTDLSNQQVWYPNDNALPPSPEDPPDFGDMFEGDTFESGPLGVPADRRAFLARPRRRKSEERSKGRGALLAAYMWGQNARRFASLPTGEQDEDIRRCLERVHPGCSKYLIDIVHWPWDSQSNPGGGGFAWYTPGQQSRYQGAATKPHRIASNGPSLVCFAGEHLGLIQGWVQGAMQTALSAVLQACRR